MIQSAKKEELEEILNLVNLCRWEAYHPILPNVTKEHISYPLEKLEEILEEMLVFVYKDEGKIIGTIALDKLTNTHGQLLMIFVHPDYQRKGIGSSLVNYTEDIAKEIGFKELTLSTMEQAQWAVKFFEKLGYKIIKKEDHEVWMEVYLEKQLL